MTKTNLIDQVEKLVFNSEKLMLEARQLFCSQTYFLSINTNHDKLYDKIFTQPAELIQALNSTLKDIISTDQNTKLKAARLIRKAAYRETNLSSSNWLAQPQTIEILLTSLNAEDDKRIIQETILALGQIVERYNFPDLRIYQQVVPFFNIKAIDIKNAVVTTLSKFDTTDKWDYILQIGQNKPNRFGQDLVVRAIRSDFKKIPAPMKVKLRKVLVSMDEIYSPKDPGRQPFIHAALDVLNDKEDPFSSLFG